MSKVIKTTIRNHYQRAFASAALLLAMALPSCGTTDEPSDPPLATLAGSEQASQLGVATWEVRADGENVRVIGLDTHSERQAEMLVRKMANTGDRVQIEAVFPEHGVFELARGGVVDGASSEFLRHLGTAVNADMGEQSVSVTPGPGDGLGTAASAISLQGEGHIYMGWSLFGYSVNVAVNTLCQQVTRASYVAYSNNGSSCWVNGWLSNDPYDCRISVHYGIAGGLTDTCNWFVYSNPPTNLAQGKPATQSSTIEPQEASRAVDGNTDGTYNGQSITHTQYDYHAWWQVDLQSTQAIGNIVLFNRTDCCSDRLSDFKLLVSSDGFNWSSFPHPGTAAAQVTFPVNGTARYVKVQLNGTNYLTLAEVQVFAPNLAQGKPATQSSTIEPQEDASRAVDGNTDGTYNGQSITHTQYDYQAWWQVDLQSAQAIGNIVLFNRTDCCSNRLSNFKLLVSSDGFNWSSFPYPGTAPAQVTFPVNRTARYVKVQLNGTNYLTLAEVQVFAP